jgi:hypothetical protein
MKSYEMNHAEIVYSNKITLLLYGRGIRGFWVNNHTSYIKYFMVHSILQVSTYMRLSSGTTYKYIKNPQLRNMQ